MMTLHRPHGRTGNEEIIGEEGRKHFLKEVGSKAPKVWGEND